MAAQSYAAAVGVETQDGALGDSDLGYATLLSELVYRSAECRDDGAFDAARAAVEAELDVRLPHVRRCKSGGQRYLVAESAAAIYVAFQGTKSAADWLANLSILHGPLWCPKHMMAGGHARKHSSTGSSSGDSTSSSSSSGSSARAHGGFIRRANQSALSISALHDAAAAAGKRLVLTGHSLGGAVATLTTVRLLRSLAHAASSSSREADAELDPRIRCISFATPAVANADLLAEVAAAGWDRFITNILIPEDPVVPVVNRLLNAPATSSPPASPTKSSSIQPPWGSITASTATSSSRSSSKDNASSWVDRSSTSTSSSGRVAEMSYTPLHMPVVGALSYSAPGHRASSSDSLSSYAAPFSHPVLLMQPQLAAASDFGSFAPSSWQPSLQLADVPAGTAAYQPGSEELASWLAAAKGAVQERKQRRQHRRSGGGSLSHSSSNASLQASDASDAPSSSWGSSKTAGAGASGSSDASGVSLSGRLEATLLAASAAAVNLLTAPGKLGPQLSPGGVGLHSPFAAVPDAHQLGEAAAAAVHQQPGVAAVRLHRLGLSRAKLAWLTGAVAAGVRCAAALAAPQLLGGPHLLGGLLPRGLWPAPVALAALHFVGSAALRASMPASHPLGQQWVLTREGLQPADRPLKEYPKCATSLRLRELGGLFPGHRMIAYRRRVVALKRRDSWP